MAIIIGADGGPLGGPLKALEAAGEALATNHQLQTQARQEERQNTLDIQGMAERKQIMGLRDADEMRRKTEMTLRQSEEKRREADYEYTAKIRARDENERVAAKTGAASRLKAYLGTDIHDDPSFLDNGMTAEEKRAVKTGLPIETLRELEVLAEQAPNLSPEQYQASLNDTMSRAKPLIAERRKANVMGLLSTLSAPSASSDGTEQDAVIDEKRSKNLQEYLDQGGSPDEVERVLMNSLRAHSQRQAATHVNLIRTQGLGEYLTQIATAGNDPNMASSPQVDPESLSNAFSIHRTMEKMAPFATPEELAAYDREARRAVTTGSAKSSSGSGSGKNDRPWTSKPREQWTEHDAYNDAYYKAIDAVQAGRKTVDPYEKADQALAYWRQQHPAQQAPAAGGAPAAPAQGGWHPPMLAPDGSQPAPQPVTPGIPGQGAAAQGTAPTPRGPIDPDKFAKSQAIVAQLISSGKIQNNKESIQSALEAVYDGRSPDLAPDRDKTSISANVAPSAPSSTMTRENAMEIVSRYEENAKKGVKLPAAAQAQEDADYKKAKEFLKTKSEASNVGSRGGADYERVQAEIRARRGKQ